MKDFFEVGIVTTTHGLKGEVKACTTSEDPKRFKDLSEVYLLNGEDAHKLVIESVSFFKNLSILKFKGVDSIENAERLRGQHLFIPRNEALPLSDNEYYIPDLLGCKVYLEDETLIGTLRDVIDTGATDVYVVARENEKDVLIPAVDIFIRSVDPAAKKIVVRPPDGLLD